MALDASGNVGTWEWDLTTDIVVGDDRMARLSGVDPRLALQGAPVAAYMAHIHPDDFLPFSAAMQAAFAQASPVSIQFRLLLPEGGLRWLAVQGRSRNGPDGRPMHFSGVTLDITEAKRNEAALLRAKEEREFILALVERQRAQQDADAVMQITAEAVGRRLGVHRAGFFRVIDEAILEYGACWVDGTLEPLTGSIQAAMFGSALGEIIRSGRTLSFGGLADRMRPTDEALDATGTCAGISVPLIREGRWEAGFYLSHGEPRDWTPEEVALVEEVAQLSWDAVARVRAVAALRAMNASLAGEVADRTAERDRIWEVSQDLLGIAGPDGEWHNVNPAWTRVLGWQADEIVGRTSDWLLHPDDVERTHAEVGRLNAGASHDRFRKSLPDQGWRVPDIVVDGGSGRRISLHHGPRRDRGTAAAGGVARGGGAYPAGARGDGWGGRLDVRHRRRPLLQRCELRGALWLQPRAT